jgi:hypothetical protein
MLVIKICSDRIFPPVRSAMLMGRTDCFYPALHAIAEFYEKILKEATAFLTLASQLY